MYPPYNVAATITKSDTVNIPEGLTDAVYVGGAGDIAAVFQDGEVVVITCIAGGLLPLKVLRINSTDTTATKMTALYRR